MSNLRVVLAGVVVAAVAVTGAATPAWAAPNLGPAELSPDYQSEVSLRESLWAPPASADDQVSPGVNAPSEPWQPFVGGRFKVKGTSPEAAQGLLEDYVEAHPPVELAPQALTVEEATTKEALVDEEAETTSPAPSEATPSDSPAPEATSPQPTSTEPAETPAPAPVERAPLTAEDELAADDGAVTPFRAPAGTAVGAPGLGALPFFSFDEFSVSDDTVVRVNLANGNLLVTASDAILSGPGVGLRADRFYNGLSSDMGVFGGGWSSSVANYDVGIDDFGSTAVFLGPSGIRITFTRTGPGVYSAPSSFDGTLTKGVAGDCTNNPEWCFTLTYNKSGEQLKFSQTGYLAADFDRNGIGTSYTYMGGSLVGAYQSSGRSMTFDLNPNSGPQTMTDSANRTTTYDQNGSGQLWKVTSPDGVVNEYTYDSTGRLASMKVPGTNPTTTTITFGYDSQHRVTSITQQASSPTWGNKPNLVTNYTYASGLTTVTDPLSHPLKYAIDSAGRVTSVTDAQNRKRSQSWNGASRIASTTDALGSGSTPGNQTTYSYDQLANTTGATLPTGAAAQAVYAQGTNCPSVTSGTAYQVKCSFDATGNSTKYEYDPAGNATREINTTAGGSAVLGERTYASGAATGQCSPKKGQLCTSKDGKGAQTSFLYDNNGNLKKVTPPSPMPATNYNYDSLGRVTSVIDGNGKTTSYQYDLADRLVKTTFSNSNELWAAWYPNGTKQYDWDRTRWQTTYDYDRQGLMTAKNFLAHHTNPVVESIKTQYDAGGNMTRYEDARGAVAYGYNAVDELRWLHQTGGTCTDDDTLLAAGSECIKFRYNANGVETLRYLPGQAVQERTIDKAGRIKRIEAQTRSSNGATGHIDIKYDYNTVAFSTNAATDSTNLQRSSAAAQQGILKDARTSYTYDSQNRLIKAEETYASSITASWQYQYDGASNRISQTRSGTTGAAAGTIGYTYNPANQLTAATGDTTTWTYDGAGNQTRNGLTGKTSIYNDRGQVTETSNTGYGAYGAGNNELVTRSNQEARYRSSALGLAYETHNVTGFAAAYTRLPDGEIVGSRVGSARNYFITDHLKSVVGIFNGTVGGYIGGYAYSPYGEARFTGTNAAVTSNPIRYISGYWDAPSGLYKLGARFYDPSIARFTQMDPSGQEKNPYAYAGCNPIGNSDPSGLNCANAIIGLAIAIIEVIGVVVGFVALASNPLFLTAGVASAVVLQKLATRGVALLLGEITGVYGIGSGIAAVREEC